jgi:hypothetical protein
VHVNEVRLPVEDAEGGERQGLEDDEAVRVADEVRVDGRSLPEARAVVGEQVRDPVHVALEQAAELRLAAEADGERPSVRTHAPRLPVQRAVGGQQHAHVVTERSQRLRQGPDDVGQPADLHERCRLGGDEEDLQRSVRHAPRELSGHGPPRRPGRLA